MLEGNIWASLEIGMQKDAAVRILQDQKEW